MTKVSIVCPIYNMTNAKEFLKRNLDSILLQSFKDYEIVISDDSSDDMLDIWIRQHHYPVKYFKNKVHGMAGNTNNAIEKANGNLIKILYQDDYFYHEDSLQEIVKAFIPGTKWLVTACIHSNGTELFNEHQPFYSKTENTIGSPSVLTFKNSVTIRFDPKLFWVLDLDFYRKCFQYYGLPKILNKVNVVIGIGEHQSTFLLSDRSKAIEEALMKC